MTNFEFKNLSDYKPEEIGFVLYEVNNNIYNMLVPLDIIEKGFYKKGDYEFSTFQVGLLNCIVVQCTEPKHNLMEYFSVLTDKKYKYSEKLTQLTYDSLQISLTPEDIKNLKMVWGN